LGIWVDIEIIGRSVCLEFKVREVAGGIRCTVALRLRYEVICELRWFV
jgi:hypothetical protein